MEYKCYKNNADSYYIAENYEWTNITNTLAALVHFINSFNCDNKSNITNKLKAIMLYPCDFELNAKLDKLLTHIATNNSDYKKKAYIFTNSSSPKKENLLIVSYDYVFKYIFDYNILSNIDINIIEIGNIDNNVTFLLNTKEM